MKSTVEIGRIGEEAAANYLISKGYKILERNFRSRYGEIDIICEYHNTLVFAEIKNLPSLGAKAVEYLINRQKRNRIIETSRAYLHSSGLDGKKNVRYDIVVLDNGRIDHLEGAFYEGGIG